MSYQDFITRQIDDFKSRHPLSEGWHILKNNMPPLSTLPEFLDKHPGIMKSSEMLRGLGHRTLHPEDKLSPEFRIRIFSWVGTCELQWHGEPIAIKATFTDPHQGYPFCFLVAARNTRAVTDFYRALLEFNLAHNRNKRISSVLTQEGDEVPVSGLSWDDVILPRAMRDDLRAGVETFFRSRDEYKRFSIPYKRGFIFSGPAGCGKTLTAKIIIATMKLPSYLLTPSPGMERMNSAINWTFENAAEQAPAVLLIEELEKFSEPVYISTILNLMDGLSTMRGVLVIATTNYPERIDPALLLRPSRFDRIWHFPLPDREARLRLLAGKARGAFADELLQRVADLSSGFSMAYVQEIFASAMSYAMRENRTMTGDDMLRSVETLKKQIKTAASTSPEVGKEAQPFGFTKIKVE